MVSSTQNEYNEDGVYLYSLNTKTCTWEKSRYNGQIPSSKINININHIRSLWAFCKCNKTKYNILWGMGVW